MDELMGDTRVLTRVQHSATVCKPKNTKTRSSILEDAVRRPQQNPHNNPPLLIHPRRAARSPKSEKTLDIGTVCSGVDVPAYACVSSVSDS